MDTRTTQLTEAEKDVLAEVVGELLDAWTEVQQLKVRVAELEASDD